MPDEGNGDIDWFILGDIRGVDIDGDWGGGNDIGVEGEERECFRELLRLCFLYLTLYML
jgi:hypothetical protein